VSDAETIDDYELVDCIATGNATQIWEVKQPSGQTFAMKLLLEEAFADAEEKKALKHEANVGKQLDHPNIIKIFDLKMTRKFGYFTMEHFRSPNLKSMIRNDKYGAQSRCPKMLECLVQALSVVHRKGWIHRDIKPENVLVNKSGEVRLVDFSLSSKPSNAVLRAFTKKSNIAIQGTRTYLAPELIKRQAMTFSVDMYSLGITIYETLVGHPPFRTGNPNDLLMMHVRDRPVPPSELDDNITPEADLLIAKMLAKSPKDRPESMDALAAELRSIRLFKQEPLDVMRQRIEDEKNANAQVEEDRLNSRKDAERSASGQALPPRKKKPKPTPKVEQKPAPPAPQQPAAGVPQQPMMPQQPGFPMQPGMPMQPNMMPGYPMQPGMPMPGYPMPGQPGMPPPGYPMPGQPGMPMPGYPMQGQPGMPPQPGQQPHPSQPPQPAPVGPVPQVPQQGTPQPAAPQPVAPQPVAPAPATPTPKTPEPAAEQKKPEDIPMATFDDLDIEFES